MTTAAAPVAEVRRTDRVRRLPGPGARFLELFTLSGFAVAEPLYSVFRDAPEEFIFRRISEAGVLLFTVALLVGPPLALWVLGSLAARARPTWGLVVHLVSMACLWFVLGVEALQRLPLPVAAVLLVAFAVAALATVLTVVSSVVTLWLRFASPAPVVFALIFVLAAPVRDPWERSESTPSMDVRVGNPAPVVIVVLDELPLASLIGDTGSIEADLFPNLASLQTESHAFLNATSNSGSTATSLPSLLTGQVPTRQRQPLATDYPKSIFTLLGRSYDMRVHEHLALCPTSLCPQGERVLSTEALADLFADAGLALKDIVDPTTDGRAGGETFNDAIDAMAGAMAQRQVVAKARDRPWLSVRFAAFLDDLARPSTGRPPLAFLHLLLPHAPWVTLPDGRTYLRPGQDTRQPELDDSGAWSRDASRLRTARQRHMLQVQYADRLIGELVTGMKRAGTWDTSAVVITSDHGMSLQPGVRRRGVSVRNLGEVAWVPLFVKEPGQRSGSVRFDPVQLLDVMPTIADILEVEVPWRLAGRSLLGPREGLTRPRLLGARGQARFDVDARGGRRLLLRHAASRYFPERGDPLRLYRVGAARHLLGAPVSSLDPGGTAREAFAAIEDPSAWDDVELESRYLPTYVRARIHGLPARSRPLVIVNGVVAAVGDPVRGSATEVAYTVMIPPALLRGGKNALRIGALEGDGRLIEVTNR